MSVDIIGVGLGNIRINFKENIMESIKYAASPLVCGIGIRDLPIKGNEHYYKVWKKMIERCYHVCYAKNSVVDEPWLIFSKFKSWMVTKNWKNKDLDKDCLSGVIYSKDTCVFLPRDKNILVSSFKLHNKSAGGHLHRGKYRSTLVVNKVQKHLGYYDTLEEARRVWLENKLLVLDSHIQLEVESDIINALKVFKGRVEYELQ